MAGDVRVYSSVPSVDLFVEMGPSLPGASPIVIDDSTRTLYAYISGGVTVVGGGSSLPTLAAVATSGAYGDLSGTPTITTVAYGTITPTLGNVTGINTVISQPCRYSQVGNIVTFAGIVKVQANFAAGGNLEIGVSLPVTSAFTNAYQASGGGAQDASVTVPNAVLVYADVTTPGRIILSAAALVSATMADFSFNSVYQII